MKIYEIITEGDCEGRSVKHLGYFSGHLEDILLYLANKAYYKLSVSEVEAIHITRPTYQPTKNEVHFEYNGVFDTTYSTLSKSNYYNAKKLQLKNTISDKELERAKVLASLTPKQREVLGL